MPPPVDIIGKWSEIKLEIVRDYAKAYSQILSAQNEPPLYHIYVDAFAGGGIHLSRATGDLVLGSPLNALLVDPPFREFHFIDIESERVESLRKLTRRRPEAKVYGGDCNAILLSDIFPAIKYEHYRRGLCLLDPYGLHLDWKVIRTAGQMRSIELFVNFPLADMNRNVLWHNPEAVSPDQAQRMTRFWGDDSWKEVAYTTTLNLYGIEEKVDNPTIAQAFRDRLKKVAGFQHVPAPVPMKNKVGAVLYYLYFASHKPVAGHIVESIFEDHKRRL